MIIDLVDDITYANTNCYVHQLTKSLDQTECVKRISLQQINTIQKPNAIICRLKQRTVFREINKLRSWAGDAPIVFYDQDPWEALKDNSPFKGTYDLVKTMNLKGIAVTTQHFANLITERDLPGVFVKMGMLPAYCVRGPTFSSRRSKVAFIGTLHPRRKKLVDELKVKGIDVFVHPNSLDYEGYLKALNDVSIFIHNEDEPIIVDGQIENMGTGLWIKDVEAAARGCFSVRNYANGFSSYCDGISSIKTFETIQDASDVVRLILELNDEERQSMIDESVSMIANHNDWFKTAQILIGLIS